MKQGERAYTIREIDDLREVINTHMWFGHYWREVPQDAPMLHYPSKDSGRVLEEKVRTTMWAGLTADDLIASEGTPKDGA
jgi:hypothetical protein